MFEGLFNSGLNVWWSKTKKLLELLTMSVKLVRNWPLLSTIAFRGSDSLVFRKIIAMFKSIYQALRLSPSN